MSESRNVQVVKDAYAAFQRGDINGVIALVDDSVDCNIKTTGRSVASDWVMVFTLRDGKVVRFREWTDSAQLVKAYGAA